jgi:hypothetical protein
MFADILLDVVARRLVNGFRQRRARRGSGGKNPLFTMRMELPVLTWRSAAAFV